MATLKQQAAGRKGKTIILNWRVRRHCGALALPQLCGRDWTKLAGRTRIYSDNVKGDPWKVRMAARLRRETTMTLKWIAERLCMDSWKHLNGRLDEPRKST
jgi:hypothetical protein